MYQIELEQFQGPFDLLLQLIEKEELNITELSLSKIADQYIRYLEEAEDLGLEEIADFLVVAAKLLLIKSKVLLPSLCLEGEEEAGDLEKQLKIYREYLEASQKMHKMILKGNFSFCREKSLAEAERTFNPPRGLKKESLAEIFADILKNIRLISDLPEKTIRRVISLREKIRQISDLLATADEISFARLMEGCESKVEIIVNFLAVLELVKARGAVVVQENTFQEIVIRRIDPAIACLEESGQ